MKGTRWLSSVVAACLATGVAGCAPTEEGVLKLPKVKREQVSRAVRKAPAGQAPSGRKRGARPLAEEPVGK
jgi:hypothetical protein